MRRAILLGASGSIGQQALDVIEDSNIEIVALSVYGNIEVLRNYLKQHKPQALYAKTIPDDLIKAYPEVKFFSGDNGIEAMQGAVEYDLLINALVGYVGLLPTYRAIKDGKDVALANKETLVMGGDLINRCLRETDCRIYPIDSEHSAIAQCMAGSSRFDINRLIITASGGAFRDLSREDLKTVTKEDALKHPTWSMGAKITIDSATMMNKGYEVIEAHHLFNIDYDDIDVIMHKDSIVHSLVEFNDGSVIAQLSEPDMRLPINYALFGRHASYKDKKHLDLRKVGQLDFKELSFSRYPLLEVAYKVGKMGGNMPAVMTGANDTAVDLFLHDAISFLEIEEAVIKAIDNASYIAEPSIADIIDSYESGKEFVLSNY